MTDGAMLLRAWWPWSRKFPAAAQARRGDSGPRYKKRVEGEAAAVTLGPAGLSEPAATKCAQGGCMGGGVRADVVWGRKTGVTR